MISNEMSIILNEQINKELYSAYLYQSMSAYSMRKGFKGTANWFQLQAMEEIRHAQKIYQYILDQGEKIELEVIDKPPVDFGTLLNLFEETLKHEKTVTASINNIVELAKKEKDNATFIFLQWFITEQIEEEAIPQEIIDKLKIIGENGGGLYMLDKELGSRAAE